jgi:hypothetical protein
VEIRKDFHSLNPNIKMMFGSGKTPKYPQIFCVLPRGIGGGQPSTSASGKAIYTMYMASHCHACHFYESPYLPTFHGAEAQSHSALFLASFAGQMSQIYPDLKSENLKNPRAFSRVFTRRRFQTYREPSGRYWLISPTYKNALWQLRLLKNLKTKWRTITMSMSIINKIATIELQQEQLAKKKKEAEEKQKQLAKKCNELKKQQQKAERKLRTKRHCKRAEMLENMLPDTITLTDDDFKLFLEKTAANESVQQILANLKAEQDKHITVNGAYVPAQSGEPTADKFAETTASVSNAPTTTATFQLFDER